MTPERKEELQRMFELLKEVKSQNLGCGSLEAYNYIKVPVYFQGIADRINKELEKRSISERVTYKQAAQMEGALRSVPDLIVYSKGHEYFNKTLEIDQEIKAKTPDFFVNYITKGRTLDAFIQTWNKHLGQIDAPDELLESTYQYMVSNSPEETWNVCQRFSINPIESHELYKRMKSEQVLHRTDYQKQLIALHIQEKMSGKSGSLLRMFGRQIESYDELIGDLENSLKMHGSLTKNYLFTDQRMRKASDESFEFRKYLSSIIRSNKSFIEKYIIS